LNLSDLLAQEDIATIRARLVASLSADGFPVDSWAPSAAGGVENMRLDMSAGVGAYLPPRIVGIVNGRILPLATGAYLKALGAKFYGLTQRDATPTIENIALYAVGTPGQLSFAPGDLLASSPDTGNRYRSIDGGQFSAANTGPPGPSFPTAKPLMLRFQAENPGSSYDDQAGTITTLVTARAGVRCVNVAPADYTPAAVKGTSTGTLVATIADPHFPGVPSVRVQIMATGNVGTAAFRYTVDGGVTWSPTIPMSSSYEVNLFGSFTHLAFASSAVSPSFIAGDILTVILGDAILQRGNDAESEAAFRRRCSNRWPSLSDVPVAATVELWAMDASPEVARISVDADPNTSGGMIITIASSTGPASAAAQIAVEDYAGARLLGYQGIPAPPTSGFTSPAETVTVLSALPFDVTATGPVRVPKAKLAQAQVAANVAWNAYLADLPLGGQPGAVVELAELAQILADAGAIDIPSALANLTINGVSADAPIPTGQVSVPAPGQSLLTSIVWIPA